MSVKKTNEVVTSEVTNNVITSEVITPMALTVVERDTTTTKKVKDIDNISSYKYTVRLSDNLSVMRASLFLSNGGKTSIVLNNNAFNTRWFNLEVKNNVVIFSEMHVLKDGRTGHMREVYEQLELVLSVNDFMSLKTLNVECEVEVVNGEAVLVSCVPVVTLYNDSKTSIEVDKVYRDKNDGYVVFWNALINK